MGTARQDYVRFLRWIHEPQRDIGEPAKRFAHMVLSHFDEIAGTVRQRNARSAALARLARLHLAASPAALPPMDAAEAAEEWPWRRFRALTVGPFRGFRREERFDLSKRVILFYGPNGSGKTSLCEALERGLLGSVEEAELKRIDERRYLTNIHAGRFVEPRLVATTANGDDIPVISDADLYRFSFIEKNRIDAFSRMAARPQAQRTELIAALFGMDKFNGFVGHFNELMDAELVLRSDKQAALQFKRESIVRDQAMVRDEVQALARHDEEDSVYAQNYAVGATYAGLKDLLGTPEVPGRLQDLNQLLDAVPPNVVGLTRQILMQAYEVIDARAGELRQITQELTRRSSQVSFMDLYTAVTALQADEGDRCPACNTPLAQAVHDPYEKARTGLGELKDLADLQARQGTTKDSLDVASRELREYLCQIASYLAEQDRAQTVIGKYLARLPAQPQGDTWWTAIYDDDAINQGDTPSLEQIATVADEMEQRDDVARAQIGERAARVRERDGLLECRRHVEARDVQRKIIVDSASEARARIEQFEVENAALITQADEERRSIERDEPIKAAYDDFLVQLRSFRDQLPGVLMAGLNELTMTLYNEFNHLDHEQDKLVALYLPLTGEQRIEIAFQGAPEQRVDALVVLSEGHVRCLGLAILLAKCIHIGSPVVVFDDAINAIDHDHRNGIRQTIFDGDRFVESQIIVTCHSPEFIKDIQNSLPHDRRADCQEYLLMYHDGDHHPRIRPDIGSFNYLLRAQEALDRFDPRDALSYARKALEMLSKKSWKWLKSHDVGELTLLVDGPGNEPTLRALCEGIRKKLRESPAFAHPSKEPLLQAVATILGIPSNLIWISLNKGTHEEADRDDFDREQVALVIRSLQQIDRLELRPGR